MLSTLPYFACYIFATAFNKTAKFFVIQRFVPTFLPYVHQRLRLPSLILVSGTGTIQPSSAIAARMRESRDNAIRLVAPPKVSKIPTRFRCALPKYVDLLYVVWICLRELTISRIKLMSWVRVSSCGPRTAQNSASLDMSPPSAVICCWHRRRWSDRRQRRVRGDYKITMTSQFSADGFWLSYLQPMREDNHGECTGIRVDLFRKGCRFLPLVYVQPGIAEDPWPARSHPLVGLIYIRMGI